MVAGNKLECWTCSENDDEVVVYWCADFFYSHGSPFQLFNITPCFIYTLILSYCFLHYQHLTGNDNLNKFKEFTSTIPESCDMSSGLPIIYATLNVPIVSSYPSSRCLQWSGDGQACFVSKYAIYILVANPIQ